MTNQDGGDAGGIRSTEDPSRVQLLSPNLAGGEVVIPITFDDTEKKGLLADAEGHQGEIIDPSLVKPVVHIKPEGRKLSFIRGKQSIVSRSKGQGSWFNKLNRRSGMSPGSELLTVLIAFAGLSLLVLFACLVATKIILSGCGWSMCIRFHSSSQHALARKNSLFSSHKTQGDCVFRRFEPHLNFPMLEIIHDFKSRHSALLENRGGLRCLLFDMRHYMLESDSCPSAYPSSLDERLGVPALNSRMSHAFPRRFARHFFADVKGGNSAELRSIVGPVIYERCKGSNLQAALLVEIRMESKSSVPAQQYVVDALLKMSDSAYKPVRSLVVSDQFAETIVMYENWNKNANKCDKKKIGAEEAAASPGEKLNGFRVTKSESGLVIEATFFEVVDSGSALKEVLKSRLGKNAGKKIPKTQSKDGPEVSTKHRPESVQRAADEVNTQNEEGDKLKSEDKVNIDDEKMSPATSPDLNPVLLVNGTDDIIEAKVEETTGADTDVEKSTQEIGATAATGESKKVTEANVGADKAKQPTGVGVDADKAKQLTGVGVDADKAKQLTGVGVDADKAKQPTGAGAKLDTEASTHQLSGTNVGGDNSKQTTKANVGVETNTDTNQLRPTTGAVDSEAEVEPLPKLTEQMSKDLTDSFGNRLERDKDTTIKISRSSDLAPVTKRDALADSGSESQSGKADAATAKSLLSFVFPAFEITKLPDLKAGEKRLEGKDLFKGHPVMSETRRYYSWRGHIIRVCQIREMSHPHN